jgi:hypothetical protein
MTNTFSAEATDGVSTYLGTGDPVGRLADYGPAWSGSLAVDVTLEGSLLDGASDAVRASLSRLLRNRLAGTTHAGHFLVGDA